MHRRTAKLWLPSETTQDEIDRLLTSIVTSLYILKINRSFTTSSDCIDFIRRVPTCLSNREKGVAESKEDDEDDDLDKLLEQYNKQAEEDKAKVLSAVGKKTLSQMGMKELRETGLAQPLSAETK